MGHKAPALKGRPAQRRRPKAFPGGTCSGGVSPRNREQEAPRVPWPSQASGPTGPSLTSPGSACGGSPPHPALGPVKTARVSRFCMGKKRNVPTATKRPGWTARIAGSCPGALATSRGAGGGLGVCARAGVSGHRGSQRGRPLQARAGVSGYRGCARAGVSGHRGSQRGRPLQARAGVSVSGGALARAPPVRRPHLTPVAYKRCHLDS